MERLTIQMESLWSQVLYKLQMKRPLVCELYFGLSAFDSQHTLTMCGCTSDGKEVKHVGIIVLKFWFTLKFGNWTTMSSH